MNEKNKEMSREISIRDMLLYVCQRWRSILLWMAIGAVLLGFLGWYKSGTSTSVPVQETSQSINWDQALSVQEKSKVEQVADYQTTYKNLEKDGNPDSWLELYNKILARGNIDSQISSLSDLQKQYFYYLTEGKEYVAPADPAPEKRHFDAKHFILGAVLGILISAIIVLIKYAVSRSVKSSKELENYGFQVIGTFSGNSKFYQKRKAALDKKLKQARLNEKKKLTEEEKAHIVSEKISLFAESEGVKNLYIVSTTEEDLSIVDNVKEGLKEKINVSIVKETLDQLDLLKNISSSDGVVFTEQLDRSKISDIFDEYELCKKYGLKMIGIIAIQ